MRKMKCKPAVVAMAWALFALLLSGMSLAQGADGTLEALSDKVKAQDALIQELVQKVKSLEAERGTWKEGSQGLVQRVEALEKSPEKTAEAPIVKENGISGLLDGVKLNAYVDAGYGYNFNRPKSRKNTLRVFDVDDNNFSLNMAEMVLQKPAANPGEIGFRMDLLYGYSQSRIIHSLGSKPAGHSGVLGDDDFDLQQAYVSYKAPIGNGLAIDVGKWITHMGAEVIQGYDGYNDNYSRSLLFGFAIPFTHTGIKATYPFSDQLYLMAGVANGWDVVKENNKSKHYMGQLGWAPNPKLSFLLNYGGGPEQGDNNRDWRHMWDLVAIVKPVDRLALTLNYDFGSEEGLLRNGQGSPGRREWQGFAGIVRYDFNDWLALAVRGEFFNDDDGVRTGGSRKLRELTFTPEIKLRGNLIVRPEFRHDWSNRGDTFEDDRGGFSKRRQDTFAVNFLYKF